MFQLFRKKKIRELTERADFYVRQNYVPEKTATAKPAKPPLGNVKFSKKDGSSNVTDVRNSIDDELEHRVQYSRRGGEKEEPQIRYSMRGSGENPAEDRYDPSVVTDLMRNYRGVMPPASFLKALDRTTDKTFVETLSLHIQRKGLRDTEVYKAAQIDRRLFSKIMSDRDYTPSKDTIIALAFALHLALSEVTDLLLLCIFLSRRQPTFCAVPASPCPTATRGMLSSNTSSVRGSTIYTPSTKSSST